MRNPCEQWFGHKHMLLLCLCGLAAYNGIAGATSLNSSLTLDSSARESLESKYARGLLFIDVDDIGVKHCVLTGTIHKPAAEGSEHRENEGQASRLDMFLTAARHGDNGRVKVCGAPIEPQVPHAPA